MEPLHHDESLPAAPSDPPREEPAAAADIDFERAAWDADYRRKALAILRRTHRGGRNPPQPAPKLPNRTDEQR